MTHSDKVYVAGHRGLAGSAITRELTRRGYNNLLLRTSSQLDLRNQAATMAFFEKEKPVYVFLAAGRVGGILANNMLRAQFIYDNLMIASNVIHASYTFGVRKLVNLGSSCIYPKHAPQPMKEEYLLTGPLEPTNEPYAIAKIAAIKIISAYNSQYGTNYLSLMPTNLYGPNDNFDAESSHVLAALVRKMHDARLANEAVVLWGDGSPRREFLYVDDLASAALFLMEKHDAAELGELINVGTGSDVSIKELATKIAEIVDFTGEVVWDTSKPNGTPQKLLDVSRMAELGWRAKTSLEDGIRTTYDWFKHALAERRLRGYQKAK
jgi:GDP-L-fucose synthase